jgi:DNA-binding NtrC family response regulator
VSLSRCESTSPKPLLGKEGAVVTPLREINMKKEQAKILIIDDDEDILFAFRLLVQKYVSQVHTEKNPDKIAELLKTTSYDLIFLDMNFERDVTSGKEGFYWLNKILEIDPSAVVILITAYGDVEMAVKAVKEGAVDFILKPWQNEKLLATISATLQLRKSRLETKRLRVQQRQLSADIDQPFQDIIGQSAPMKTLYQTIHKVAGTEANVLILGENGTGKELVARAIHRQSLHADKVFISVDMGAISETLFESELFGHVKGAFTDAKKDHTGRFEIANGGTLFLDEIGNLPFPLQSKLLTVLDSREVTPVGANRAQQIDIRLICATNMPIMEMVKEDRFRQDLLYRINTVEIQLPPLRERREDIQPLVDHFMAIYAKKYNKNISKLASGALNKLQAYHWPGNIRELQHAIERAIILSEGSILECGDFLFSPIDEQTEGMVFESYNLDHIEKTVIKQTLQKHGGNVSTTAKELGLTRASLYRRMEKFGL